MTKLDTVRNGIEIISCLGVIHRHVRPSANRLISIWSRAMTAGSVDLNLIKQEVGNLKNFLTDIQRDVETFEQ